MTAEEEKKATEVKDEADQVAEEQVETSTEDSSKDKKPKEEKEKKNPKSQIEDLTKQLEEAKTDYLRIYADFDNYRKRTTENSRQEKQNGIAFAIESLLPALDSIDRAMTVIKDQSALDGMVLVKKQFEKGLQTLGVEEISTEGLFDAKYHNAIMREASDQPTNTIIEVFQKGYKFKDRVLRYAMVKVAE